MWPVSQWIHCKRSQDTQVPKSTFCTTSKQSIGKLCYNSELFYVYHWDTICYYVCFMLLCIYVTTVYPYYIVCWYQLADLDSIETGMSEVWWSFHDFFKWSVGHVHWIFKNMIIEILRFLFLIFPTIEISTYESLCGFVFCLLIMTKIFKWEIKIERALLNNVKKSLPVPQKDLLMQIYTLYMYTVPCIGIVNSHRRHGRKKSSSGTQFFEQKVFICARIKQCKGPFSTAEVSWHNLNRSMMLKQSIE